MSDSINQEIIYGKNAVTEALRAAQPIEAVYILKASQGTEKIAALAKKQGVVVKEASDEKLKGMCGAKHGGVAAVLSAVSYCTVEDILNNAEQKGKPPFIIICDEIQDPHNLGAVIRTAEAAGADGVIIPKRRGVGVNATVFKTSAGAAAWVKIARVTNLVDTIKQLKKSNVWVYGAEADGTPFDKADLSGAVALVIGSEGFGLGKLVRENCDMTLSLPMHGRVNSLNASVSAGILIYEVLKHR